MDTGKAGQVVMYFANYFDGPAPPALAFVQKSPDGTEYWARILTLIDRPVVRVVCRTLDEARDYLCASHCGPYDGTELGSVTKEYIDNFAQDPTPDETILYYENILAGRN